MQKNGIFRNDKEQRERFLLLPAAENILKENNFIHERRLISKKIKWQGRVKVELRNVEYWIFTSRHKGKRIRLVIRQFEGGKKHFLTIYKSRSKEKSPQ